MKKIGKSEFSTRRNEDAPAKPRCVQTVIGVGYKYNKNTSSGLYSSLLIC